MTIEGVMTTDVKCCSPEDSLSTAAVVMWDRDCGCVPVVDETGRLVGIVTDRDICMAGMLKGVAQSELRVGDVIVGAGDIPHFTPMSFSYTGGGITCGYELGPAVGDDYTAPFRANFTIDRVVVDVSGEPYRDPLAEFQAIMAEQ